VGLARLMGRKHVVVARKLNKLLEVGLGRSK